LLFLCQGAAVHFRGPLAHRPPPAPPAAGKGKDDPSGGDYPSGQASCRDNKDKKSCRHSKSVCSWCEGSYGPAMCLEEVRARGVRTGRRFGHGQCWLLPGCGRWLKARCL
jgi:hypothetical protein